jgi:mRNA interferase RelE/StbE
LRLSRKIDSLSLDPRPPGVKKLKGEEGIYRIRDGDFRIIYKLEDQRLLILVLSVGNRREVYRR